MNALLRSAIVLQHSIISLFVFDIFCRYRYVSCPRSCPPDTIHWAYIMCKGSSSRTSQGGALIVLHPLRPTLATFQGCQVHLTNGSESLDDATKVRYQAFKGNQFTEVPLSSLQMLIQYAYRKYGLFARLSYSL